MHVKLSHRLVSLQTIENSYENRKFEALFALTDLHEKKALMSSQLKESLLISSYQPT